MTTESLDVDLDELVALETYRSRYEVYLRVKMQRLSASGADLTEIRAEVRRASLAADAAHAARIAKTARARQERDDVVLTEMGR